MLDKESLLAMLDKKGIKYERHEHHAVFTIEEMDALNLPHPEEIVKNLFLRDDKKKNYYLVTFPGHKNANLRDLSEKIPSRKLSFAGEEDMTRLLGLKPGSVTPLGALNDEDDKVTVVFDKSLQGTQIGIHPMENTGTIFLPFETVRKLLKQHGTTTVLCDI
jgi:Ala-tRNA(Pro) deacylase